MAFKGKFDILSLPQLLSKLQAKAVSGKTVGEDSIVNVLAEDDGTLRSMLVGWNGSAVTRVRVDAAGFVRTRPFEPFQYNAPVLLTSTITTHYTVPASTVAVFECTFFNIGTGPTANLSAWLVPSGGAAGNANKVMTDDPLVKFQPRKLGPLVLEAGAFFQARVLDTTEHNTTTVHFNIKEYGTGDAVAL